MANIINTEVTFEINGATYTRKANGYCYVSYEYSESGKVHRISKAEFETKYTQFQMEEAEEAFEKAPTDEQIESAWVEVQQMMARGEVVEYKGSYLPVRTGDFWGDPMNSCFYYVVDVIEGQYEVCRMNDSSAEMFALRNLNANPAMINDPKAKKRTRKSKDIAFAVTVDGVETTLTAKQVDFIRHLPDTCFWERGLDSALWTDVLADEIGGQFAGKPMTTGAMISTICEKGLAVRATDRINGRKATFMELTGLGKVIAAELGLN